MSNITSIRIKMKDKSIVHTPLHKLDYDLLHKGDIMKFNKGDPTPHQIEIYPYVFVTRYKPNIFKAKIMSIKKDKWGQVFVNTRELK